MNSNIAIGTDVVKPKVTFQPIQDGQMYNTKQATARLGVSPNTLKKWVSRGLPVYHPLGSKHDFYFAEDLREFVRTDGRRSAPNASPTIRTKPTARKRKD